MFISVVFIIGKKQNQPKYSSIDVKKEWNTHTQSTRKKIKIVPIAKE